MKKNILALCLGGLSLLSASAFADEASVKKGIEEFFGPGAPVQGVRKAGALGLYEVQIGSDIVYTDEKVTYVLLGNIIDVKAKKDLTEERKNKLSRIKFSDLPLDLAIKQVKGNGKRVIATFEDPNCGYCKKLAKELQGMTDVTIYTFLMPILSPNSQEKSKGIWCADDKAKAWNDWMVGNMEPTAGKCDANAVGKSLALGQKLGIRGTPTIFFANGERVPGYMPAAQLEERLNQISAK
ncbi:MAG: DsbC family protein [Rhodocyclaceae bacterium]|nr:DsbC family protein [Rhodocyclaceae bacterium]